MSTSTNGSTNGSTNVLADGVLHGLLGALVDDAALFPPGSASMPDAVAGHRRARTGPLAPLVGRFLCPALRLDELRAELAAQLDPGGRLELGLIADGGAAGLPTALAEVASEPRLTLGAVEIPLPPGADPVVAVGEALVVLPAQTPSYVELPRVQGWQDALAVLAAAGRGAKLRTGGLSAELFPSESEVAAFITGCVAAEVPFKCTAGLHRAVRHTDPDTGFEHHGFLNILLATVAAVRGCDVLATLAERDGSVLAAAARSVDSAAAAAARRHFVGYGSCSITEPARDLVELGLL